MSIKFKSITTALLAASLSLSVMTFDPIFSEPTTVEAATAQQKKAKKIKKIKASHRKKIATAKRIQVKKNKAAKAAKANDKQLKKLNGQKRAQQKKIKTLNKTIAQKKKGIPKATPNTDEENLSKIFQPKHRITRNEHLPTTLKDPKMVLGYENSDMRYYGYVHTAADKSSRINGRLTPAQQKEVTDYTITLINSYLRSQGLPAAKWSTQMHTQTMQHIKLRHGEDFSRFETGMHPNHNIYDLFSESKGLKLDSFSDFSFSTADTTLLAMKVGVLNKLTNLIYNPTHYTDNYTIQRAAGQQLSTGIGLSADYDRKEKPYRIFFLTAKETGYAYQHNQKLTATQKHRSKPFNYKKELTARNAATKKVASINKQIKSRNASLNRAMKKKFKANNAQFNKTKKQADRVMKKQLRRA